jgi:hypothetical protein
MDRLPESVVRRPMPSAGPDLRSQEHPPRAQAGTGLDPLPLLAPSRRGATRRPLHLSTLIIIYGL